jgi:ribosomal protein S18 acetylase RimI-like enzyme
VYVSGQTAHSGPEVVRALQEKTARALPAEHVAHAGGWWLRHSPSSAWWAGTVLPHGDAGPDELVHRVVGAENFYAGYGVPARFQISPGACPGGLDTLLAERGYHREWPMSLQVASAARVLAQASTGSLPVRLDDHPTDAWFEVWHAVHGHGGDVRSEWDMLGRVERPCAYAAAMSGDDVVAVGRVVADDGWAGVFGMATLPQARGKGVGRAVLAAAAEWAEAHEAGRMYLQVERDNLPAQRLYDRAGFGEICGYHYRTVCLTNGAVFGPGGETDWQL